MHPREWLEWRRGTGAEPSTAPALTHRQRRATTTSRRYGSRSCSDNRAPGITYMLHRQKGTRKHTHPHRHLRVHTRTLRKYDRADQHARLSHKHEHTRAPPHHTITVHVAPSEMADAPHHPRGWPPRCHCRHRRQTRIAAGDQVRPRQRDPRLSSHGARQKVRNDGQDP